MKRTIITPAKTHRPQRYQFELQLPSMSSKSPQLTDASQKLSCADGALENSLVHPYDGGGEVCGMMNWRKRMKRRTRWKEEKRDGY
jgi:uncharacterized membrane protein